MTKILANDGISQAGIDALTAKGFSIDRKSISLKEDTIKELGKYEVTIKLHKEVSVVVPFEVVAE